MKKKIKEIKIKWIRIQCSRLGDNLVVITDGSVKKMNKIYFSDTLKKRMEIKNKHQESKSNVWIGDWQKVEMK